MEIDARQVAHDVAVGHVADELAAFVHDGHARGVGLRDQLDDLAHCGGVAYGDGVFVHHFLKREACECLIGRVLERRIGVDRVKRIVAGTRAGGSGAGNGTRLRLARATSIGSSGARLRLLRIAHEHQYQHDGAGYQARRGAERHVVAGEGLLHAGKLAMRGAAGGRDRNQQRGAERARHLVDGVRRGLRMLNGLVGQRIHTPGVHGRHGELDADGHDRVHQRDHQDGGVNLVADEADERAGDATYADEHRAAHAMLVEQAPGEQPRERADDRAGEHRHAADGGALPQHALNVKRHDGLDADERGLEQRDDDDDRAVLLGFQDIDAQHGLVKVQLAIRVGAHERQAHHDERYRYDQIIRRAERRQTVQQADQADRRKHDRRSIELAAAEFAIGLQFLDGQKNDDAREHGHDHEDGAPAHGVHQHAGKRGADGGSEADDQPDDAHGRAATFARDDQQDDAEHHRHDEAGGAGLHDAPGKQEAECRRACRDDGPRAEQAYSADEQPAGGKAPHQVGGKRNDHGFGERIAGREPLHGGGRDVQVAHDGRQRRRQQRRVQHGDERAGQKNRHHLHFLFRHS